MNKLLIHNQNTILLDGKNFSTNEQFVFQPGADISDVDHYITAELENGDLRKKLLNAEVVFVKIALSANYLEYLGLRLAYHLRLTQSLKEKNRIPIILVGEESYEFLGRTSTVAEILFTKGVYLIRDNKEIYEAFVKRIAEGKVQSLIDEEAFLEKIKLVPPANYQTHHSITNEWSILRWADMAKNILDEDRKKLRENIKTTQTLYFKYLEAKSTIRESRQSFTNDKKKENLIIPFDAVSPAKIYYIDDEQRKGWGELFSKCIFKEYSEAGRFNYCVDFPKGEKREEILIRLKDKIGNLIKEDYNVFIIDLRLCDEDFDRKVVLSGFELIKEIKRTNKGIQVVIFTASKKAENVNISADIGVTRYVLKESPEHVLTRQDSYDLFLDFSRQVKDAISKSFLASLYDDTQNLKRTTLFATEKNEDRKKFRERIISNGGIPDKIFALTDGDSNFFLTEAFLNAYKMLEKLCFLFFIGTGNIEEKNNTLKTVIRSSGTSWATDFHLKRGQFSFQSKPNEENVIAFEDRGGTLLKVSDLAKVIAVLKFRFGLDKERLDCVIEMNYLRSNLAAHDTGSINLSQRKIELKDLLFLKELLVELFK